jgi:steroid 5-alpha reductase family enzyme
MNAFFVALAISVLVNSLFFAVAAWRKADTVTDLSYSLSFALTAVALVIHWGAFDPLRLAAAGMVVLWALRLAAYLFGRILKMKVDHRFDGIRENILAFARFWILQAISVSVIMLPVIAILAAAPPAFSLLHALGAALWLAGLLVEVVADAQKSAWKKSGEKGLIMTGLWSWSRHPNYFGEALLWWALWIYALPSLAAWWHLAVLGPICITLLLLRVTGIPLLEKSAEERYGNDLAYRDYKARTSVFFPLPPRRKTDRPIDQ